MYLQSTLLITTRTLLARAGLKRLITHVSTPADSYLAMRAGNGRASSKGLYLPVINRTSKVSILGLLESTGATERRWLCNGQASTGTRQILHFGDSGRCFIVLSRAALDAELRRRFGDDYDRAVGESEWHQANLRNAPARSKLILRTPQDEDEIIELPPEELSEPIYMALRGHVQIIAGVNRNEVETLIDKGFGLTIATTPEEGSFLLGQPHALTRHYQEAA